jgi:hypothetical protein
MNRPGGSPTPRPPEIRARTAAALTFAVSLCRPDGHRPSAEVWVLLNCEKQSQCVPAAHLLLAVTWPYRRLVGDRPLPGTRPKSVLGGPVIYEPVVCDSSEVRILTASRR